MRLRVAAPRPEHELVEGPERIRVERRGPVGFLFIRIFFTAALLPFAVMPPVVLYHFSDGSWLAALLSIPVFTLFPWYPFIAGMAWTLGRAIGSLRWIEVDGGARCVRACRDAHFLWGRRTTRIDRAELRSLVVELDDSDPDSPAAWVTLEAIRGDGRWPWSRDAWTTSLPFRSAALAERDRFFAFARDVGRLLGLAGRTVERNDHLGARIRLHPSSADESPGPAEESDVRATDGADAAPDVDLPPFDPGDLRGAWEVEAWEPGSTVRVRKAGLDRSELVRASVLGTLLLNVPTIAAGIALATGAAAEVGLFWKLVVGAVGLAVTLLYNGFLLAEARTEREAVLDWGAGECRLRRNGRALSFPLNAIEGVAVAGLRRTGGSDDQVRWTCEVWVLTPEGRGKVAETATGPTASTAYAPAAAMAEELAASLGVAWRWEGWEDRSPVDEARTLWRRLVRRHGGAPARR